MLPEAGSTGAHVKVTWQVSSRKKRLFVWLQKKSHILSITILNDTTTPSGTSKCLGEVVSARVRVWRGCTEHAMVWLPGLYWPWLYWPVLVCTVLVCTGLYCTGLYWSVLYWPLLAFTVLGCTGLYKPLYQARESSLVLLCLLTAHFLQKT